MEFSHKLYHNLVAADVLCHVKTVDSLLLLVAVACKETTRQVKSNSSQLKLKKKEN